MNLKIKFYFKTRAEDWNIFDFTFHGEFGGVKIQLYFYFCRNLIYLYDNNMFSGIRKNSDEDIGLQLSVVVLGILYI
mgnify:CR=1 FL=1